MTSIEHRVVNIENRIFARKNGLAEWALTIARNEESHRAFLLQSVRMLNRVFEREGWPTREIPPHLFELDSEEKVLDFARKLSERYSGPKHYELNKTQPDWETLNAKIRSRIGTINQNKEI